MNCSRNEERKEKILTGVLKALELVIILGFLAFVICLIFPVWGEVKEAKELQAKFHEEQITSSYVMIAEDSYGKVDEYFTIAKMSEDWSSGSDLDFIPLDVPMDEDLQEFIFCASYGYNIEFPFVMALINQESTFRSDIISDSNDYGLMQINKINHEWLTETLGITNYLDPYENVRAGTYILMNLFEKYEDPAKVLMAYNMGERTARRFWKKGIFATNYSNEILECTALYEQQISEKKVEENAEG